MGTSQPVPLDTTLLNLILRGTFIVVVIAIGAFIIVGAIAFYKTQKGGGRSFGMMIVRAVPFLTVVLIVLTIAVFCLTDRITGKDALTVFGSVVGFVLGRASWRWNESTNAGTDNDDHEED